MSRGTDRARKPAKRGSYMGWAGYELAARSCIVCGQRVTLTQEFQAHTENGVKWVRHIACKRAAA